LPVSFPVQIIYRVV